MLMNLATIFRVVKEREQREKVVTEMEKLVNRALTIEERGLVHLSLTIKYELDLNMDGLNGESAA